MPISSFREEAKHTLAGQWGINVLALVVGGVLTLLTRAIAERLLPFADGSWQVVFLEKGLAIFITFAFFCAQYMIALNVIRGGHTRLVQLFAAFQNHRYLPLLLLNLFFMVVRYLVILIVFLPILFQKGLAVYSSLAFGERPVLSAHLRSSITDELIFFLLLLVLGLAVWLILLLLNGLFQFSVLAVVDHPAWSVRQSILHAASLLKGHWGKYLLLQLSFIGWYILGLLALGFGIFWALTYRNVSNAAFYNYLKRENTI